MSSTRDAQPGDVITFIDNETGFARRLTVATVDDQGIGVVYFTPEGLGPYHAHLPHTSQVRRAVYEDERVGGFRSHWQMG